MFSSIGLPELIIIFAILLLLFGGKRLPQVARAMGESVRNFQKSIGGRNDTDETRMKNEISEVT